MNNDWRLIIAGDGEDKQLLLDKIKMLNLKNVELLPSTPHVNELYDQSSIYVMTSRFEGFPMVLLEAKASGLPIVAYDCDTGPSELIINHDDGFLIPFDDNNTFTCKLALLMNDDDLRESMSIMSLKNAEKYKIEVAIGDKWKRLIESI